MQAPDSDDSAARRAGGERRVLGIAFAQPGQEVSDIGRGDVSDLRAAGHGEGRRVALQIAPVRLERVRGEAALDGQVVEISIDRPGQRCQVSTSASGTAGKP
jgi:hypothetical protein